MAKHPSALLMSHASIEAYNRARDAEAEADVRRRQKNNCPICGWTKGQSGADSCSCSPNTIPRDLCKRCGADHHPGYSCRLRFELAKGAEIDRGGVASDAEAFKEGYE